MRGYTSQFLQDTSVLGVSGILHSSELMPLSVFANEQQFIEQCDLLDNKFALCKDLNCYNVSIGIDPFTDLNQEKANIWFYERVKYIAQRAKLYNININLEYISHIVAENNGDSCKNIFCSSVSDALRLLDRLQEENISLLLDILHWYASGAPQINERLIEKIGFVHLCDMPQGFLTDFKRILPGKGQLPIQDFLVQLSKGNYTGPISVEVFKSNEYNPSSKEIVDSLSYIRNLIT